MTPFILLGAGLLMIYLEFYLPGGIMGAIGGLLVLGSMILFAVQSQSIAWTITFVLVALYLVLIVVRFALYRIQKAGPEKGLYSIWDQEGYQASAFDKDAIGKRGVVSFDLKPGGRIVIEGKTHQAISKTGYIPRGEEVEVIGGEGESLIVKLIKKEKPS